jgi:hypothetical protein
MVEPPIVKGCQIFRIKSPEPASIGLAALQDGEP